MVDGKKSIFGYDRAMIELAHLKLARIEDGRGQCDHEFDSLLAAGHLGHLVVQIEARQPLFGNIHIHLG